jgi:hypothetical protein
LSRVGPPPKQRAGGDLGWVIRILERFRPDYSRVVLINPLKDALLVPHSGGRSVRRQYVAEFPFFSDAPAIAKLAVTGDEIDGLFLDAVFDLYKFASHFGVPSR